jgi:hypothetical protein
MNTTEHNQNQQVKTSKLVRILVALLLLAIVFWAGMAVGYRKAEYSYRFSDNYMRTFGNRGPGGMMGVRTTDDLVSGHGAAGRVITANLPTIIVSDRDGVEKNILITNETIIRSARTATASTTIKTDDFIVVLGTPNENGTITAKLIRVMPPITSMSSTTPPNGYGNQRGPGMMYTK